MTDVPGGELVFICPRCRGHWPVGLDLLLHLGTTPFGLGSRAISPDPHSVVESNRYKGAPVRRVHHFRHILVVRGACVSLLADTSSASSCERDAGAVAYLARTFPSAHTM